MSGQNFFSLFDKLIVRLTDEITLNENTNLHNAWMTYSKQHGCFLSF